MTQEEKELLLKDLCARLPYGVICHWCIGSELTLNLTEYNGLLTCINKVNIEGSNEFYWDCYFDCNDSNGNSFQNEDVSIEIVKPYLRPISSMTEEECDKVEEILGNDCIFDFMGNGDIVLHKGHFTQKTLSKLYDFYNSIHVDYHTDDEGRTMIERGLALEAPEGMYNLNIY